MGHRFSGLRWNIIAPVGLLAIALLAVAWLDISTGGDAKPDPLVGAIGTPVRGTLVVPTSTPIGARATPKPRPTVAGVTGSAAERDSKRFADVLSLISALNQYKDREGAYPSTENNLQTLCAFKDLDQGCKLKDVLGHDAPEDPLGDPIHNGYWYQSDGTAAKVYTSLESDIPDDRRCPTDNPDLQTKPSLICVNAP